MHHSPSGAGLPRPQPSTRQWRLCIRPAAPLGLWCIVLQTNARNRSALLLPLKVLVIVCVFVAGIPSIRRVDCPRCNICRDICLLCNEQEHTSCGRSFCKRTPAIEACCSSLQSWYGSCECTWSVSRPFGVLTCRPKCPQLPRSSDASQHAERTGCRRRTHARPIPALKKSSTLRLPAFVCKTTDHSSRAPAPTTAATR
jgi:hypothetical protein